MIQVLIVEDDPMVAEINKKYLEALYGFKMVGVVSNGEEALAFLDNHPVDLVLLDIFMPKKNGLELLADIRSMKSSVDVILISAASDIQSIKSALRLGAFDYLIKPFEFERFHAALVTYQKEQEFISKQKEQLSQEQLDRFLSQSHALASKAELPKGLTKETLQRTVNQIFAWRAKRFSTTDLSEEVGISRVSMRKYLSFLTEIGFITAELNYKSTGRPVYQYHLNGSNSQTITPFID
ncbi:MAG TPA: response regulator [Bacillales bacterium]|nr:response regulator [Bacillales bacterium]